MVWFPFPSGFAGSISHPLRCPLDEIFLLVVAARLATLRVDDGRVGIRSVIGALGLVGQVGAHHHLGWVLLRSGCGGLPVSYAHTFVPDQVMSQHDEEAEQEEDDDGHHAADDCVVRAGGRRHRTGILDGSWSGG